MIACAIVDEVPVSVSFDRHQFAVQACELKQLSTGSITFTFVSKEKIRQINTRYLKHRSITDIITFNLATPPEPVMGDIYICLDQAKQNAAAYSQTLDDEIKLLIVHGILHLLGYADYTETEQTEMRNQESLLLNQLRHGHPSI